MVWDEFDLLIRGELEGLNVCDEIEEDALERGMGYAHGTRLEVLVLFAREVMCVDPPAYAISALKDVDPMTSALEEEGRVKTGHPRPDNSYIERYFRHFVKGIWLALNDVVAEWLVVSNDNSVG